MRLGMAPGHRHTSERTVHRRCLLRGILFYEQMPDTWGGDVFRMVWSRNSAPLRDKWNTESRRSGSQRSERRKKSGHGAGECIPDRLLKRFYTRPLTILRSHVHATSSGSLIVGGMLGIWVRGAVKQRHPSPLQSGKLSHHLQPRFPC
jgi:hypothetical protein